MKHGSKVVVGAMYALLSGLCITNAAFSQALPDGKGKAELVHNCTVCHNASLVVRVRKTPEDWRKTVDNMAARGTDGTKEDMDNVVLYLDTNFAIDNSAPATTTPSTTPSSTSATPAPNTSETDRVKHIVVENNCLACHRIEKDGAYTGPTLNGEGARRTTDQIRAAIVSPHPTLDPSNDLVQLTTPDGKRHSGRLLSQDDHDVRVMNASGEVATYPKSGLLQFTVVTANPMPPFEGKITGADLDGLVRYLSSLPPVDDSAQK